VLYLFPVCATHHKWPFDRKMKRGSKRRSPYAYPYVWISPKTYFSPKVTLGARVVGRRWHSNFGTMTNAFKRELIARCKKNHVPVYDRDSTTNIAIRLQKKLNEKRKKHKKVGRPPKVEVTVAKTLLKRKKLGVTGSADVLLKRLNKHDAKKTPNNIEKNDIMKINKVNVKADDLQELLNLRVGTQCEFRNGVVKTLKKCSTGGYRWKTDA
jgi:hypothetical protein